MLSEGIAAGRAAVQQFYTTIFVLLFQQYIKPPQPMHMFEHFPAAFVQRGAIVRNITQRQRTIAAQIHIPYLDIGLQVAQVILG